MNWSKNTTLKPGDSMRSQFATASSKRNVRFRPYAFTEHGAIMAATVLNSPKANDYCRVSINLSRSLNQFLELIALKILEKLGTF